jgi:hypothetical protein
MDTNNQTNESFIINKENIILYIQKYYRIHYKSPIMLDKSHPFRYYHIKQIFQTWNNALRESGIPLNRNKIIVTQCKLCKKPFTKQFKEIIKSLNDFCSHTCSATYNNKGRKMSEETKQKIREKLQVIRYTNCTICSKEFSYRKRKNMTCGDKCLGELKKINNKKRRGLIIDEY